MTGITTDGGYAEFMIAPAVAVARMPDGMGFAEAAPLLCAGVTTFNEVFPLARAQAAVERMMSGRARFRAVLEIAP